MLVPCKPSDELSGINGGVDLILKDGFGHFVSGRLRYMINYPLHSILEAEGH